MNRVPPRNQPLVVAIASVLAVLVVVGAILLVGRITPSPSPSPTATTSATPDLSTPEGAVRAFFDALIAARRTDNPQVLEPFVTGVNSSAYRTVAGFLEGQRGSGKASITTTLELKNIKVVESGDTARLTATLLESGYDIKLDTGEPLESPVTLQPRELIVELRRANAIWKVESFETRAIGAAS
jgi:hypothetical protein